MSTRTRPVLASSDPVLADFADEIGTTGPVAIEGGRTRWDVGGPGLAETRLVRAPVGIVDYRPEEMIVCVRAGTTVADLSAALAERSQRCALPLRGGTVGGAVSVGEDAVDVLGRGAVRDAVLQVRYVSAEGRIVTGGGPVVKNVSGFNLPRLLTGSLGTLGSVAEVILRTNPIPPASVWLRADGIDPFVIRDALLRPSCVLWDGRRTWVHIEGHAVDVEEETVGLRSLGTFEEVAGPPDLPPHRWSTAPADVGDVGEAAAGAFVASIGVGRVWAEEAPRPSTPDPAVRAVADRTKSLFDPTGRLNPGRRP